MCKKNTALVVAVMFHPSHHDNPLILDDIDPTQFAEMKEKASPLLDALFAYDLDTYQHCIRVGRLCYQFGKYLGKPRKDLIELYYAGIMHDVGKIYINYDQLINSGSLSGDTQRSHVIVVPQLFADRIFAPQVGPTAQAHHENWDGTGYPDNNRGDQIPEFARIVRIIDSFDAIFYGRHYHGDSKPSNDWEFVTGELLRGSSRYYDPKLLNSFYDFIHVVPLGLCARMQVNVVTSGANLV